MHHHNHLTLEEREDIMCLRRTDTSISQIARMIRRSKSTVSRELARNSCTECYRASDAQRKYAARRRACRRVALLEDAALFELVRSKFIDEQWSPRQIEGRLVLEGRHGISDTTIYRAIDSGVFDGCIGGRKARRRLRHCGKRRKVPGTERRGKIKVSHDITERPSEADARSRLGDWEADTVAGKLNGACLVTLVDRKSGLLVGGKADQRTSSAVSAVMITSLEDQVLNTVTPDRGKELAAHREVTSAIGVEFFFALPHHPWERGSNENTNGLLREYFAKGRPIDGISCEQVQRIYDKLNRRPRKRLGYRTPYEVHYSKSLHLV